MIALHLLTPVRGIRLAAISNRSVEKARLAFQNAGVSDPTVVSDVQGLEEAVESRNYAITSDAGILAEASNIDVILEVTGTVEFAAQVSIQALRNRKHLVLVNAELDSTLGPILRTYADRAGVVFTNTDGDEPGVAMTLLRYLRSIGMVPVAAGNLKGMIDRYRNPDTQRDFARKFNQDAGKVTSFADGTKLSMEATVLSNATGFSVAQRGMIGPECKHVKDIAGLLPSDLMVSGGLVDYALGAEPHTGAFVVTYEEHEGKRKELAYYKMGDGPFYVFYTPYHLPHIQIASTIARAALFSDPTVAPRGGPTCHVITVAKKDLREGDILDGVGGFCSYGLIEKASTVLLEDMLPIGLSSGCSLLRGVKRDDPITIADIEPPRGRVSDRLWQEQRLRFAFNHSP
jgi:predicted homoserine dehydrogenase-like protein